MSHRFLFMLFSYLLLPSFAITHDSIIASAITYELNGGRFGDNLLSYSRAKWLSYFYDIPLMLCPFPYADQLKLYEKEQPFCLKKFDDVIRLSSSKDCNAKKSKNTLYINHWKVKIPINWNDPIFIADLKTLIAPRNEIKKVSIPKGYLSVAVHLRKGGVAAVDTIQEQQRCPLRFLSDEFYIAQVQRIATMYPEKRLYVYIFTDHKKPKKLIQKFQNALPDERIVFDYQKEENGHDVNVLEDFFSMMQFNCLIRPGSHFSRFVERLGDAQLVIYPHSYSKKKNQVDVIGIKTRTANGWKTTKETII